MAEELEKWLVSSNEALNINLVRPTSKSGNLRVFEEPFHPTFTYPIFGEDETIFGYIDLELNLDFRANDLKLSLDIQYEEKWKPIGHTKAMDLKEMLKDYLPEYVFDAANTSADTIESDVIDSSWKPPGKLLHSYLLHGKQFEIWSACLADPAAKEIFRRMQIFIPFYIEGGTCQNLDDQDWTMERWTLFLVYEVTPLKKLPGTSPYTIAGFSTSYRLWIFPTLEILRATGSITDTSNGNLTSYTPPQLATNPETFRYAEPYNPLSAPSRERISQFVILPPYQSQSHGTHLYNTMFTLFVSTPNIYEITVEDPNEAFDDMRDYCDMLYLRTLPAFASLSLPTALPASTLQKDADIPTDLILGPEETLTALRRAAKISPRQFARLVEMHLLSTIPPLHRSTARITRKEKSGHENDRRYYFWRLALKERLYRHNADQLAQMEQSERIEKVEETAKGVEADYTRLLEGVEKRAKWAKVQEANGSAAHGGKRKKRVVDEEDEDDDEDVVGGAREVIAAKRPKVAG
ncbi:histone acetyltransferase type B [Cenococcum geophilum 1.58]|uniref:histone acetyltransferase type B n=1 Tax=Cenococcum geophilum 1.58 TaxID=794803 RepID=UPI00358F8CB9|nr:histone acetyltransferase type B [Cenococcum geophilum 1.58]